MLKLFEDIIATMEKSKRIKEPEIPSALIFELLNMTTTSKCKVFAESADWVDPKLVDTLMEHGLIQGVVSESGVSEKFALTFKGIVRCIHLKYGKTFEEQYDSFLEKTDQKFNTSEQTQLLWNEKVATLALILLASTSPLAAIRLNSEANKVMLTEVFQKTLVCLKNYGMVRKEEELKTVSRGESLSSALMSRLDALPRKTNYYYKYIGKGSEYFLDIQLNQEIDAKRMFFLLRRIFENYIPACDYRKMYKELAEISQLYYPRFISRSVSPTIVLGILRKLKDFMDKEILNLPLFH
jgi:hypothetical protein